MTETKNTYEPNGTEEVKLGILHNVNGYWVSNEGTKQQPNYHVWIPSVTHSVCDSAYAEIDLAVCRCNYLAKNKIEARYQPLQVTQIYAQLYKISLNSKIYFTAIACF